jgi:hypothetical protein
MKLLYIGSEEQRKRWFKNEQKGYSVCISAPDYDDLVSVQRGCGIKDGGVTDDMDLRKLRTEVSQRWFCDFKGFEDASGKKLENTLENRVLILTATSVFPFVMQKLNEFSNWEIEGNGGSGSV